MQLSSSENNRQKLEINLIEPFMWKQTRKQKMNEKLSEKKNNYQKMLNKCVTHQAYLID